MQNVNVMATVQLELLSLSVEEEEEGRTLVDSVGTMLAEEYWFAVGRKRTHTQKYIDSLFKLSCTHLELCMAQ